MRRLALLSLSTLLLAACNGSPPAKNNEEQAAVKERSDGGFFDRERERERENEVNLRKAANDIYGPMPEDTPTDGEDQ